MRLGNHSSGFAWLVAAFWPVIEVNAAEFKRFDGIHRLEKRAQITQPAVLFGRDEAPDVCGTSLTLCPSSLNGGCCPNDYACAKESCYATTKGPSTCGTKVGWHVCGAIYGGGCCPDGYMCQTAGNCVPPSGSPYTHGCPTNQYLCPSSLSYGCCPNSMGCAVNQCYSTKAVTITTKMVIVTTEDGNYRMYTTTATTVKEPELPTELPEVDSGEAEAQFVLKYFPSAIAKITPTSTPEEGDASGSLSTGALAGIVTGAIAFLILVIVAAFIVIRHLNKVIAAVSVSKASTSSRPPMRYFKPTDSEVDALSVDPLMMSPHPSHMRKESAIDGASSTDQTPNSFHAAMSTVNSQYQSVGNPEVTSYFDGADGRFSQFTMRSRAESQGMYAHVRHWSNASEDSDVGRPGAISPTGMSELDSKEMAAELPGSPSSIGSHMEDALRRFSSWSTTRPPNIHQRMRSGEIAGLGVVDEEIHGFYGPLDGMVGQTKTERPESWHEGDDAKM